MGMVPEQLPHWDTVPEKRRGPSDGPLSLEEPVAPDPAPASSLLPVVVLLGA